VSQGLRGVKLCFLFVLALTPLGENGRQGPAGSDLLVNYFWSIAKIAKRELANHMIKWKHRLRHLLDYPAIVAGFEWPDSRVNALVAKSPFGSP